MIFDIAKKGTESPELEAGIEFHRIGFDLIQELLEALAETIEKKETALESDSEVLMSPATAVTTTERLRRNVVSVPKLSDAAFLGEERDRTISFVHDSERAIQRSLNSLPSSHSESEEIIDNETTPQIKAEVTTTETNGTSDIYSEENSSTVRKQVKKEVVDRPAPEKSASVAYLNPSNLSRSELLAADSASTEDTFGAQRPNYDVLLGSNTSSAQYGALGEISGRKVALDLDGSHTISLFGVQGGGKSYTLGAIAEMASLQIPNINCLPQPLTTIIFHYSPTQDYSPEFTSMVNPNSDQGQVEALRSRYGAEPQALKDVILLTPEDKLRDRQRDYPDIAVHPLKFAASELQVNHWRFLMGAVGNQATYIRQLKRIMKANRNQLSTQVIREGIDNSTLSEAVKGLAHQRLDLASEYISEAQTQLTSLIKPGRLVIVDLRDEFIEKDEALGLFLVLLQLFSETESKHNQFNKLVVFDEAHKYIDSPELTSGLIEIVSQMRHKRTSIMIASQDPSSIPTTLIELSSEIILHKFNSPAWLKHVQKANAALDSLTPRKMTNLNPGEAYVWSNKATDDAFMKGAMKIQCRPRITQHGGATKTAT